MELILLSGIQTSGLVTLEILCHMGCLMLTSTSAQSSEQYSNKTAFECVSNSKDRAHLQVPLFLEIRRITLNRHAFLQEYARTVYDYVLK
jgi:hypothetical protein